VKLTSVVVSLALLLVSCGGGSDGKPPPTPNGTGDVGLRTYLPLSVPNGEQRTYHLFVPKNPATSSVIFLLHGNGGSSDQILGLQRTVAPFKLWMDLALKENLLLVIPDGETGSEGRQGWNDCRNDAPTNPLSNDMLFLSTLIDQINKDYPRTSDKVFVNGVSNGGMMSMRLAEEIPEKLIAFASIVASEPVNTECVKSNQAISGLIMNGTLDPILPYDGGHIVPMRGLLYSTDNLVSSWVNRIQANPIAEEFVFPDINPDDESTVTKYTYANADQNTRVVHYKVTGGGHTEPSKVERYRGIYKRIVGNQNGDIEMVDEVWEFFSDFIK